MSGSGRWHSQVGQALLVAGLASSSIGGQAVGGGWLQVTEKALRDVGEIVIYLHREVSPTVANSAELKLFASFNNLANLQALGHRRPDLTAKNLFFQAANPYVIVFRRVKGTVQVNRVFHGSRDIKSLL
jgi:plasmid stabilization system protein ParE